MAAQQVQVEQLDADAALTLLKQILIDTVQLPNAACVGQHELFDVAPGTVASISARNKSD
ncbi:MAG: hypothetical protein QOJ58_5117 [Alphaproteobacteria bacterium]|jgi:hypothetical protein|nr:hypothetical protein [Pseudonocardiales bacterium]MEA2959325.1 hypothetical protein [Alphaproteobacteria bacterium]